MPPIVKIISKSQSVFGWKHHNLNFSWKELLQNKNKEITRLNEIYQKLLENAGSQSLRKKRLSLIEIP